MLKTTTSVAVLCAATAANAQVLLSVSDNIGNELPGLTFLDGDVVETDTAGSFGSLFFAESNILPSADVDAFHVLPDGDLLLSVLFNGRTLGGLTFDDGDLVRYNPGTDTASVFELNETNTNADDIDAITVLPDDNLAFSTGNSTNTLGGVAVSDGDILGYNVPGGTFSVLHSEASIFDDGDGELNALHFDPSDGTYLISTFADETISGVAFRNGDLIRWDPASDSASLYFSEDNFLGENFYNIDAAFVVPSPASATLALAGLVAMRRRRH